MSYKNQWYLIFVVWKNNKEASQIYQELVNAEGGQALSIHTIRCWIASFNNGEKDVKNKSQFGHSCKAVTTITINKIKELINNNLHIIICSSQIYCRSKKEWVTVSKQLLKILEKEFANIITGNET
ncbi:23611_t:CDS:2 [Racocetra persica]|uniref:23611_t:CDS:1 n=1 Tax=Racocetra persica TaxID=160502 RepID=A0ACA9L4E0_9GLOM|nr:23611_t:CDS:2 [Racocetra persica]